MNRLKKPIYVFIAIKFIVHLGLILFHGNTVGISGVIILDAPSYIKGAARIADTHGFLDLKDIYHSPGFQMYLGAVFMIFGRSILAAKILNWLFYVLTIVLIKKTGDRLCNEDVALISALVCACSPSLTLFTFILQYEVLAAFLFILLPFLMIKLFCNKGSIIRLIIPGILISVLTMIQIRFFAVIPFLVLYLFFHQRNDLKKAIANITVIISGSLLLILPWSIYQSKTYNKPIYVSEGNTFRFEVGNNPNATGASFPYPKIVDPRGVNFIIEMPGKFLWLVKERFLYFWGFRENIGKILTNKGKLPEIVNMGYFKVVSIMEMLFNMFFLVLFVGGILSAHTFYLRTECEKYYMGVLYCILSAVMIPPLASISSIRFMMPVLPIIFIFQSASVVWVIRMCLPSDASSTTAT